MTMKRTHLTALLLAPLVALHAADVPATKPVTIVAFGDSTTAVRGSAKVYASVLQEELRNVRVINAGVSGNTTEMGRKRFEQDVLRHQPHIAIIQFGINDAAVDVWKTPPATDPRVSLERYEANLRHFVKTLKSKKTHVVLMTSNPLRWTPKLRELYGKPPYQPENADGFNGPLVPYCETVRQVAREEGAELLDMQQAFVEQAKKRGVTVDSLLSDGMHPNDGGHRIEADLLRELILARHHRQRALQDE
jgi:lysophospholipase L1-like esterase